jgi:hypothetical protein
MHPLDGSFLKFHRADEHLQVVNNLMQEFLKRKPYQIIDTVEINGNTKERVLRLAQLENIPFQVPLLIGDACNNLRSALDHLMWQLLLLNKPLFDGEVYFPICDSENIFKSKRFSKSIVGLTETQRTLIEGLQPYMTRNRALSFLRDVNNYDKHRTIQIISLIGNVKKIHITANFNNAKLIVPLPRQFPIQPVHNVKVENGSILARIPLNSFSRGTYVRVKSYTTINFAFEGCKTADGQIMYDVVNAMLSEVLRAITAFEPEFVSFGASQFK